MSEQAQPTPSGRRQQLDEVILSLQRLRDANGDGNGNGNGGGGGGLSTQSNGCSTYSIHCGTPQVEAPRQ
jgi:hypothetical protein